MNTDFKWRHFEGEIILWAFRWYCRYGISYRERQEMLDECGVHVDHTTLYRWVQRYAPEIEKRLRWAWRHPGSRWRVDETGAVAKRLEERMKSGVLAFLQQRPYKLLPTPEDRATAGFKLVQFLSSHSLN